ncbi:hypothetical protein BOC60_23315 [Burkholderia pseudomallei]|nr:hypothetical protein BK015_25990 [Burkholderia pseudomallei]ARK43168.1 hypothetical protein BOC60_23315 [Burkholderia pseudomallei]
MPDREIGRFSCVRRAGAAARDQYLGSRGGRRRRGQRSSRMPAARRSIGRAVFGGSSMRAIVPRRAAEAARCRRRNLAHRDRAPDAAPRGRAA